MSKKNSNARSVSRRSDANLLERERYQRWNAHKSFGASDLRRLQRLAPAELCVLSEGSAGPAAPTLDNVMSDLLTFVVGGEESSKRMESCLECLTRDDGDDEGQDSRIVVLRYALASVDVETRLRDGTRTSQTLAAEGATRRAAPLAKTNDRIAKRAAAIAVDETDARDLRYRYFLEELATMEGGGPIRSRARELLEWPATSTARRARRAG